MFFHRKTILVSIRTASALSNQNHASDVFWLYYFKCMKMLYSVSQKRHNMTYCGHYFHCISTSGLENSTRPLVFTSTKGCRASENFEISSENQILPIYANYFCDAGQVSIFRYCEA